jgi:hypothetical protein
MSKLAHSHQETMDEIDRQLADDNDYRHKDNGPPEESKNTPPFITALKTGGTKEEAIFALEGMWEENCVVQERVRRLEEILHTCANILEMLVDPSQQHISSVHIWTQSKAAACKARTILSVRADP